MGGGGREGLLFNCPISLKIESHNMLIWFDTLFPKFHLKNSNSFQSINFSIYDGQTDGRTESTVIKYASVHFVEAAYKND